MIGSLRGEIGNPLVVHFGCQAEYVFCRSTASVQQNDGRGCLLKPGANSADRLITMGIVHRLLSFLFACVQSNRRQQAFYPRALRLQPRWQLESLPQGSDGLIQGKPRRIGR
jgi:hypothetical protein